MVPLIYYYKYSQLLFSSAMNYTFNAILNDIFNHSNSVLTIVLRERVIKFRSISPNYMPCERSLIACKILLTCPTFVTPNSFRSLLANVSSSLPLISFFSKLSIYSESWSVSNQVATS